MACFDPLIAHRIVNQSTGLISIVFKPVGKIVETFQVPCGKCVGCRLENSRNWSIRCQHEYLSHDKSYFLTLTYATKYLPENRSLKLSDMQLFWKRLRKNQEQYGRKIRYLMCGEYGALRGRPHYHAIVFGLHIPDLMYHSPGRDYSLMTSETIQSIWGFGKVIIGQANMQTASYVSRYVTKKIPKDKLAPGQVPEFIRMSRNPGLGTDFYKKYHSDIYTADVLIIESPDGRKFKLRPPRAYDKLYERDHPAEFELLKERRRQHALTQNKDNSRDRLAVKKHLADVFVNRYKRSVDNTN